MILLAYLIYFVNLKDLTPEPQLYKEPGHGKRCKHETSALKWIILQIIAIPGRLYLERDSIAFLIVSGFGDQYN